MVSAILCHSCEFPCQQKVLEMFPGRGCLRCDDGVLWLWHSLVNIYIWLTISSCYGSIPLTLKLIGRYGGLSTLVSYLEVSLSAASGKNVSCPWLSPLQGWGSLTMTFTGRFVWMAHHFILLWLNPFDLSVDREEWWFEHSCVKVLRLHACRQC